MRFLHPGATISGHILSADANEVRLQTAQGEIEIPTEALMAYNSDARMENGNPLQENMKKLNECKVNQQPVSITYHARNETQIGEVEIVTD